MECGCGVSSSRVLIFLLGKRGANEHRPYDGYVFVSPEYNYGMPGGVKNAIDYLYNELTGKPILIITYGIFGGLKCSEQLETVSLPSSLPLPPPLLTNLFRLRSLQA